MKRFGSSLREIFDLAYMLAIATFLLGWAGGCLVQRGKDHHGSWEWTGWVLYGFGLILVTIVTTRLRKKSV